MMRTFSLLAFIAIAVLSCTKRTDDPISGVQFSLTAVQSDFGTSDSSVVTRATESKFQNNDAVGLFIHTSALVGGSGNHSSNLKYLTLDAGVSWRAAGSLSGGLSSGATYYGTAYYPYKSGATNGVDIFHSIVGDQSAVEGAAAGNLENSDFMIADPKVVTVKSVSEASVALGFRHVLTKLVISVSVPSVIDGVKVSGVKSLVVKNLKPNCRVNLATGGVTVVGDTTASVFPRLVSGAGAAGVSSTWECVVVPQGIAAGGDFIDILCTMDSGADKLLTYRAPVTALVAGQKITLSLSSSVELAFASSVEFVDGGAKSDVPLSIRAASGSNWTLTSGAAWLKVSKTRGAGYAVSVTDAGSDLPVELFLSVDDNSGALAAPRTGVLTLSSSKGGRVTYSVMQNYSNFVPVVTAWSLSAGAGQSQAIGAFTTNTVWTVNTASDNIGIAIAATATGAALALPYETVGSLAANQLFMQSVGANNTAAAKTSKVAFAVNGSSAKSELTITQAAPVLAVSADQSATAASTSAKFTVTGTNQKGVKYTVAKGDKALTVSPAGEQEVNVTGAYSQEITVTYAATTTTANDIKATVTYKGGTVLTHTIKQASAGPPTVTIAGTKWLTANLTGTPSSNTGHKFEANPQDKGMFYKWGSTYNYSRANGASEGEGFASSQYTRGAATNPTATSTSSLGYDYGAGLSGGTSYAGDPCQKLGSQYKTPTRAQFKALYDSGRSAWTTYQGMAGYFFGPSAASCNNTTLKADCIFLPAAGYRYCWNGVFDNEGSWGYYWSSTVYDSSLGYYCNFGSGSLDPEYGYYRSFGFSVRCVQE